MLIKGDAMVLPLAKSGCVADLELYIPNTVAKGSSADLSKWVVEETGWIDLKVISNQGSLLITTNDAKTTRCHSI